MDYNKRWKDYVNRVKNIDKAPDREPTDAEIQFMGLLIRSGDPFPERDDLKKMWLEWIQKPENDTHRRWNIKCGYIDEDGNPLFD